MTRDEWLTIGETTALTLVVRQLLARLPADEVAAMRAFVDGRVAELDKSDPVAAKISENVMIALENIFTAATPETGV